MLRKLLFSAAALSLLATGALAQSPVIPYTQLDKNSNTGNYATGPVLNCQSSAIYSASTNGTTQMVAAVSGKTIRVCGYTLFAGGTVSVNLSTGTGTDCATGLAAITPAYPFTAQTGIVDPSPFWRGLSGAASSALCITTNAAVAVQAIVYYQQL